MRRMTSLARSLPRLRRLALLAAPVALLASGCVPQDRYDQLLTANRSYQEQLTAAEGDREAARNDLEIARGGVERIRAENRLLRGQVEALGGELDQLSAANAAALDELSNLDFGLLPQGVSSALADLAARRPDLLQFDADLGMVRFASDLTFGLGSDQLSSSAASVIQQIASVLNMSDASGLAIEVVGHTDNVPISKPETRQRHPSNLHLSVHRAIAVQRALVGAGVTAGRVKVAGYGSTRPVVPNPAQGGEAANRRVEVFLIPQAADAFMASPEPAMPTADPASAPIRRPAPEPDK